MLRALERGVDPLHRRSILTRLGHVDASPIESPASRDVTHPFFLLQQFNPEQPSFGSRNPQQLDKPPARRASGLRLSAHMK